MKICKAFCLQIMCKIGDVQSFDGKALVVASL